MNVLSAMLVDSYRELNSKKLFWITMILSALVVLVFLAIGLNERGLTISIPFKTFQVPFPIDSTVVPEELFLKQYFIQFGIGIWLAWIATVLALCTTAEMFPNMLSNGAIDMMLSKPVRRLTIFGSRYLSGLLFTALQVFVFTFASFLVLGFKVGAWEPGLFIAVPVMVVFYSYLFGVCVLFGVLTRSTIAALLLTLLVWFMLFIVHTVDSGMVGFKSLMEATQEQSSARVETSEVLVERLETRLEANKSESTPDQEAIASLEQRLASAIERRDGFQADADDAAGNVKSLEKWHSITLGVKTVLPKTAETIMLLERWLVSSASLDEVRENARDQDDDDGSETVTGDPELDLPSRGELQRSIEEEMQTKMVNTFRDRSPAWIIGTSLAFEFFILGIAAWIFVRRDF
ncbi:MAG: ABC transporter permease [Phycisphaerales bacterium]